MYQLHFLEKENDLNKIIKAHKEDKKPVNILFVSLWDKYCESLVSRLKEQYTTEEGQPLYIVDSFHMPHSFMIYKTTKLPHLVKLSRNRTKSEDYLPHIMDALQVI